MKPNQIVLVINLTLFAVIGLFLVFLLNRPELTPLLTGFQALINLLGAVGFFLDRRKDIAWAFVFGFLLTTTVTVIGFILMMKYQHLIGVDEMITS